MLGICLYGDLNHEEKRQYALATFSFLTGDGNHSFHEVMAVARQIGIPYQDGNYFSALLDSLINSKIFRDIDEEFNHHLQRNTWKTLSK